MLPGPQQRFIGGSRVLSVTRRSAGLLVPLTLLLLALVPAARAAEPGYVVHGTIVDEAGEPVDAHVGITVEVVGTPELPGPALGFPIFDALGGSYELLLPDAYDGSLAVFTVSVTGIDVESVPFGDGCVRQVGQGGSTTVELQAGEDGLLPPIDVVTQDVVLGENCGIQNTPTPTVAPTLPPTDAIRTAEGPSTPASALAAILAVLGGVGLLGAKVARTGWRSR
jgi:hypothetical protein